jgi:hypothetical protein
MSFRQSATAEQSRFMSTRASMILAPRPTVLRRDGSGLGTTRGWVMARHAQERCYQKKSRPGGVPSDRSVGAAPKRCPGWRGRAGASAFGHEWVGCGPTPTTYTCWLTGTLHGDMGVGRVLITGRSQLFIGHSHRLSKRSHSLCKVPVSQHG